MAPLSPRLFRQESEAFRAYCRSHYVADLDYTYDSVAVLDGILGEAWQSLRTMDPEEAATYTHSMCLAAGSYLGEVLARNSSGTWDQEAGGERMLQWWIRIPDSGGQKAFCFQAVWEFLEKGPRTSLLHLIAPYAPNLQALARATGRHRKKARSNA